ncbi:hypothetical protein [Streptomyces sp. TS71-3]|uniref:hypothetical protein n=1 Tax=Streptomyces sp. TS71-3 TaxID=2733862 RepID=UPI001B2213FC|nr:hypothetical protein [Streptomyces sp. TS71-3]GHJ34426.1 hypothetical protein Sm713_00350 [Streptomyces sp. TS71-3]
MLVWTPDERFPERPDFPRSLVAEVLNAERTAPPERVFRGTTHRNTVVDVPGMGRLVVMRRRIPGAMVRKVLNELRNEGFAETAQGSGTRVVKAPTVHSSPAAGRSRGSASLLSVFAAAFKRPTVSLDVFTLTSESLATHMRVQCDAIVAGEIQVEEIKVRLLLPSEGQELPYPVSQHDPNDTRVPERTKRITRRSTFALRGMLAHLSDEGSSPRSSSKSASTA